MRPGRTTIARSVLVFAASALALAGLIFGLSALQSITSRDNPDEPAAPAQTYAADAAEALRSGDETLALELATKALAADPRDATAQSVADDVARRRAARSQSSDTVVRQSPDETTSGDDVASDDGAFLKAIDDLSVLLPSSLPGYGLGAPVVLGGSASLSGSSADSEATVTRVVWSINDAESAEKAQDFVKKTSRELYGSDSADVTVDGATGYFGTDGTRFATVVYTRGRYVFEVVASGSSADPMEFRQVALDAAASFKDAP